MDFEEVWGLIDGSWTTAQDDNGNALIPFFPKRDFAEYCAVNEWENFQAKRINLYDFIDKSLVGMKRDGVRPTVFPTNKDAVMVDIDVILRNLYNEIENY